MAKDFRRGTLAKIAEDLNRLKRQNLRISVTLKHQLELALKKFRWPHRDQKNTGRVIRFGGVFGVLAEDIPANSTFYETGDTPQPSRARNLFECHSQLEWDDPIQKDFWRVADLAGQIVLEMRSCLKRDAGLWSLWRTIDPQRFSSCGHARDVWLDFVFEVAWLQIPGLPHATKLVFWNGMTVELIDDRAATREAFRWLQECAEIDGEIAGRENSFGPRAQWIAIDYNKPNEDGPGFVVGADPIPEPFPAWNSMIGDVVGASQYAIDFLLAHITDEDSATPDDIARRYYELEIELDTNSKQKRYDKLAPLFEKAGIEHPPLHKDSRLKSILVDATKRKIDRQSTIGDRIQK